MGLYAACRFNFPESVLVSEPYIVLCWNKGVPNVGLAKVAERKRRFIIGRCYEHRPCRLLAVRPWRTQGCLLYLVALPHLPSFFRFDVLVTVHPYDPL